MARTNVGANIHEYNAASMLASIRYADAVDVPAMWITVVDRANPGWRRTAFGEDLFMATARREFAKDIEVVARAADWLEGVGRFAGQHRANFSLEVGWGEQFVSACGVRLEDLACRVSAAPGGFSKS